jgi:hypothetical protein
MPRTKKKRSSTRKKKSQADPRICSLQPHCNKPAVSPNGFCIAHGLQDLCVSRGRRAAKRGELWERIFYDAGSALVGHVSQQMDVIQQAEPHQQFVPQQPPQPPKADPFAVLGLDPATATKADVRRVQRKLASIYHADQAGGSVASSKMAEINAAAAACLSALGK